MVVARFIELYHCLPACLVISLRWLDRFHVVVFYARFLEFFSKAPSLSILLVRETLCMEIHTTLYTEMYSVHYFNNTIVWFTLLIFRTAVLYCKTLIWRLELGN